MPGPSPRSAGAARVSVRSASLLLLALLMGGCSGTPIGEALSRSFSGAGDPAGGPPKPATPVASPGTTVSPGGPSPANPSGKPALSAAPRAGRSTAAGSLAPLPSAAAGTAAASPSSAASAPAPPRAPANPSPYRLTLLLPQADPAAPAEVVTRALRSAGVPFEVETIQRATPGEAPRVVAPAAPAAQAAPAAPAVRPAPPPR
ncbi:MAG: hypothetical protein ACK522_10745 [Synechococcaceae cyanobacterium]